MEHQACDRMRRNAELIAMAQREDLRPRARLADKRIVRRHAAVVFQAERLADMIVERLRLHAKAVVLCARAA